MIGLADLQADFQAYLLDRPNAMTGRVNDTAKADAGLLLQVYRHGYTARLIEALGKDFNVLRQLLGDDAFDAIGRAYASAYPSRHFSLGRFGHGLPDFLTLTEPWSARPFLGELARFDWALRTSFEATDATPITVDALVGVVPTAWPGLIFCLLPSFIRLDLAWSVPQAWQAIQAGAIEVPLPGRMDEPVAWAVWRAELTTEFRSLAEDEVWALDALAHGESFAALCEGLCQWVDATEAPGRAASLLRGWVEQGMIAGVVAA